MDALQVAWWHWMLLGLVLLLGEVLTPGGFYLIFFGAAAIATAVLKLAGLDSLALEGMVFAAGAIVSLVLFRRRLLARFRKELNPQHRVDDIAAEEAVALQDIAARATGRVELRGTAWNAVNVGGETIPQAARCRIEKVDGLTLRVRLLNGL
jgi:membrane protein implicated in regulation of membrane protease activity